MATEGETKREALANLKEAIEGYIGVRAELLGRSKMKKELVEVTVRKTSSPWFTFIESIHPRERHSRSYH